MPTHRLLFAFGLWAATTVACIPVRVDSECQAKISECLRGCDPNSPPGTPSGQFGAHDYRSMCERNCEAICHG
jgi:hypothetical protein